MEGNLSTPKTLAGLGSLFVVLSIIPYIGWLLAIAGWVLLLVAMHHYGKALSDGEIFKKFLIGFLLSIFGIVIAIFFGVAGALTTAIMGGGSEGAVGAGIGIGLILIALISYALTVVAFYMYKQSFSRIASKLGHGLIGTAGTVLFVGAILTVILVGFLVLYVGWILATIGFFTAPTEIKAESSESA